MNERIKQLAEQADPDSWHKRWYSGIDPRVMDPQIKKFVELIVLECAKLVEDNIDPQNAWITPGFIKQHFGIQ